MGILKNIAVSKMYFKLNPECYFIRGVKCGAIFDLIDSKIYALNQQETDIVTSCEKNNSVMVNEKLLNELKQLRLGNFYSQRTYIQKVRVGSGRLKGDYAIFSEPLELHRAFLEINNSCNRDCWFCGYYGIQRNLGCIGCNKWKENGQILNLERCHEIVDELKALDCRDLYVTGGDLTLTWERAMDVLDYAKGKFGNIYITLHQQSLSSDIFNDLAGKAEVIVQTDDLNSIQSKNSAILVVIKPEDWENASIIEGRNMIKSFAFEDHSIFSDDLPIVSKSKISPINMHKFLSNLEYHPCLGHTLAICYNGNVIPCPMMRNHSFGNVSDVELSTVLETGWEDINKYWNLNLDKVEKCTCCEFRYTCTDCRALEEKMTGKLEGKKLCNYNPVEGVWS